jgi:hypothetical protein
VGKAKAKPGGRRGGARGGRPAFSIEPEHVAEARKLIGRHAYRSDIAAKLQEKFRVGREVAYRILDAAAAEVKAELAKSGPLSPELLAYSGLLRIATAPDASYKDQTRAWAQIVRMLQLKVSDDARDEGEVEKFLADIMDRRNARRGAIAPAAPATAPPGEDG